MIRSENFPGFILIGAFCSWKTIRKDEGNVLARMSVPNEAIISLISWAGLAMEIGVGHPPHHGLPHIILGAIANLSKARASRLSKNPKKFRYKLNLSTSTRLLYV